MPDLTLHHAHAWDVTPTEAVAIQKHLAPLVREEPLAPGWRTIAGLDVSVRRAATGPDRVRAAIVMLDVADGGRVVDQAIWEGPVAFPYVPGLLSFREVPALLPALERLCELPDVLMLDAQGRAHPRRFGLACHLGVLLDRPALGVGKTLLVGTHGDLGEEKGSTAPLVHKGETVGVALRTRARVKPVYVSAGHRITLDEAASLALSLAPKYKIPEPTRLAHTLSYAGTL